MPNRRDLSHVGVATTRQEQKERTRQAILAAALELTSEQGFAGLSLRQVAREVGFVPTAFYRHFDSMEQLGLALVEQSFVPLRHMLRDARRDPASYDDVISASAQLLHRVVLANRSRFVFIARERFGGVAAVRAAIRHELQLFVTDLTTDLERFAQLQHWSADDVQMAARLFVNLMVSTAERLVETPAEAVREQEQIVTDVTRQMRLIVIGFAGWRQR